MSNKEAALLLKCISTGVLPERVFKYRALSNRTLQIFESSALWFASAPSFNDPFDCNLSETHDHTLTDFENYLSTLPIDSTQHAKMVNIFHTKKSVVRDMCINARNEAISSRGILALASAVDNILLWSHYAKDHSGIALAFDMTEDPEFFLTPYIVKYADKYAELNYFRNREETIIRNISTKSIDWAYEKEIRILKPQSRAWEFKRTCLREVYFGCKASEVDIDKVRQLCTQHNFMHVTFFKAQMIHGTFTLEFIALP